ncbi:MAG: M48 family metalloprotease, partial [Candidatus Omnitrophica bacterium]|nr:M48 family metalloprotease [Candidatus Omnitrophota bacterium]
VNLILAIALKDVQSDLVKKAIDVMYNVIFLGYSRQDEFLADSLAVKYTIKAGYNPRSGLSLMEKLKKESDSQYTLAFLSSHPPIEERKKNIEEKIKEYDKGG